jgi:hypothetical protein
MHIRVEVVTHASVYLPRRSSAPNARLQPPRVKQLPHSTYSELNLTPMLLRDVSSVFVLANTRELRVAQMISFGAFQIGVSHVVSSDNLFRRVSETKNCLMLLRNPARCESLSLQPTYCSVPLNTDQVVSHRDWRDFSKPFSLASRLTY